MLILFLFLLFLMSSFSVRLMACQVLLHLCTHPIASAYGISTAFILKNICGMIQKCIIDVIHGKTYSKKLQREEGNDMEMENSTNFQSFHSNIFHSLLQDYYIYLPLYSNRLGTHVIPLSCELGMRIIF